MFKHKTDKTFNVTLSRAAMLFLLILFISGARGQDVNEYEVKAGFIFNFTKFLQWPQTAFPSAEEPFAIGILGKDSIGDYLQNTIAEEQVEGRSIVVRKFKDAKEVEDCRILFIGKAEDVAPALEAVKGKGTLTVSDTPDFCMKGGIVTFYDEDNMIRLEINPRAAKEENLEISSKLLRIARIYQSD